MAATSAFRVISVNGAALEGCDRIFEEARLVQRVRVDGNLDVVLVRDR